jgi:hypothetical protein
LDKQTAQACLSCHLCILTHRARVADDNCLGNRDRDLTMDGEIDIVIRIRTVQSLTLPMYHRTVCLVCCTPPLLSLALVLSCSLPLSAMPPLTPRQPPRPAHGRPSTPPTLRTSTGPASGAHLFTCHSLYLVSSWRSATARCLHAVGVGVRRIHQSVSGCIRFSLIVVASHSMHESKPGLRKHAMCQPEVATRAFRSVASWCACYH